MLKLEILIFLVEDLFAMNIHFLFVLLSYRMNDQEM